MVKECPNCGAKNFDDARVCMNCSTKFDDGGFMVDEAASHNPDHSYDSEPDHFSDDSEILPQEQIDDDSIPHKRFNLKIIIAVAVAAIVIIAVVVSAFLFLGLGDLIGGGLSGLDYKNYDYGFGLNYPDDWTVNEDIAVAGNVVQFSSSVSDPNATVITITVPVELSGTTLSAYSTNLLQLYSSMFNNFTSTQGGKSRTVNSMDAYELEYTWSFELLGTKVITKNKHIIVEKDGSVISLIYTSYPQFYDSNLADFEESVNSFEWI